MTASSPGSAAAAGHPEWAADPRFATNRARVANRDDFVAGLHAGVAHPHHRGLDRRAGERPASRAGRSTTLAEVFADPQVQARGMRIAMPHAAGADVALVANPVRLSATPTSYRHAPPLLGADTEAVLTERLGLTAAEIERLRQAALI